ncbi:hypothetical protein M9H77_29616 [Catharanthus roseus]|uniref:Uncharacterized protein n=1 Tax=Catharanthus roseus TaxID=4058 RepID=A0ACB9ZVQ2_CATRO|nr:hypothetical protein M9H77_29616 [Catharanthus roseus]
MSGRTHGRTVTPSSWGLRDRHGVSNIHTTPTPIDNTSYVRGLRSSLLLSRVGFRCLTIFIQYLISQSAQPPYHQPPSSSYYTYASCSQPSSYQLLDCTLVLPVDPQLGSSFLDKLFSGFPYISPYAASTWIIMGARHVPYYTLGLGEHGRDEGGEETFQAGGDDIEVQGDNLEDKAEQVQNEG